MSYYDAPYQAHGGTESQGQRPANVQGPFRTYDDPFSIMSGPHYQEPKLGATFYPGGFDDFLMPELISPSPQRVMPEVPSNMQEGLAHLELEAREVPHDRINSLSNVSSAQGHYRDPVSPLQPNSSQPLQTIAPLQPRKPGILVQPEVSAQTAYTAKYEHTNAAVYQNVFSQMQGRGGQPGNTRLPNKIQQSPFPKLRDAGPNVPPSNEEKEAILDRARPLILSSTNAEMQLAWAQDALLWVDLEMQNWARLHEDQTTRSTTPTVEHQLRTDAINIVNFLAEQQHPKALFLKAMWHEFGKFGYALDRSESMRGYRKSAEQGYARADYRIGTQYETIQDMAKAIKHYNIGASIGDSASSYRLGMMSLLGQYGQPQDYQLGIQRIKFAAETADENAAQGAYVYGMLLARELPNIMLPETVLPVDIDLARQYIEKAAFLGFAKAQLKMGSAYELCLWGCEFNPALSLHYNALAAHQGEADADMAISKWFLCGFEGIFEKKEELAFIYAKRAAQAEMPTAEFALGYFYEIGIYVIMDIHHAQEWYQKAADHGNRDAVERLESIAQQRTLSKKDHEQVALTRIKSQYGSQRGKRPERFKEKHAPLPPTVEESVEPRVDMPDESTRHVRSASANPFMLVTDDNYPTARPKSTAPYPEEVARPTSTALYPEKVARPKSTAPYPEEVARPKSTALYPDELARPKSTAPYPEDDVAPSRHGQRPASTHLNPQLRPMSGPPADRPSSAFGIRPVNIQAQDQNGRMYDRGGYLRPATSMGNISAVPEGRGSNPAGRNRIASAGWESQPGQQGPGYRQPGPGQNPLSPPNHIRQSSYDNGVGARNRLQKPGPNTGKPQPSLPPHMSDPGYPVTPISPNAGYRGSHMQAPASQTRYDAPSPNYGGHSRQNSQDHRSTLPSNGGRRPERYDSIPQSSGRDSQRPYQTTSPAPPRVSSAASSISSHPPPRTTSAIASPASSTTPQSGRPVKEGPKTFDEMGIPSQKNDNDCRVM